MAQTDRGNRLFIREGQRHEALQRRVAACRIVVGLELGKLPFQVTGVPEQRVIEKFSLHRFDQATNGCDSGTCGTSCDFMDLEHTQVRRPSVYLEQRIVIRTEMSQCALPVRRR